MLLVRVLFVRWPGWPIIRAKLPLSNSAGLSVSSAQLAFIYTTGSRLFHSVTCKGLQVHAATSKASRYLLKFGAVMRLVIFLIFVLWERTTHRLMWFLDKWMAIQAAATGKGYCACGVIASRCSSHGLAQSLRYKYDHQRREEHSSISGAILVGIYNKVTSELSQSVECSRIGWQRHSSISGTTVLIYWELQLRWL